MQFRRYALYYIPPAGSRWAQAATAWLGWDADQGASVPHPDLPGLPLPVSDITRNLRKYGLHATIKPPFSLAEGLHADTLAEACSALCNRFRPVELHGLCIARIGGFLALRPEGDESALRHLANICVKELDLFRAAPGGAELARRRAPGLSEAQEALLTQWGYPYVMQEFRFHITLSARLAFAASGPILVALDAYLAPHLPHPFVLDELALAGEAEDGQFHLINRYPLGG